MKTRSTTTPAARLLLAAMLAAGGSSAAYAATIIKADNTGNLTTTGSWVGGVVPGVADIAQWNSTVTAANTVLLGANLSLQGISVTNPGGAVTISAGNTLTLLSGGIDMSGATQNLTINATVALGDTVNGSAAQTWNVASGRTLTIAAVPVRNTAANNISNGGVINVTGSGTTRIGTAASTVILDGGTNPFVTFNTNDWAATNASGNVIAATYTNDTFTNGTNVNIVTAGTYAINGANPNSVRFANTGGAVTVNNANTSTLRGILMAAGSQNVSINSANIRPNRVSVAGATMSFIQNSTSGVLNIGSNINNASSGAPVTITKSGVGTMILSGGNSFTGNIHLFEGTLQLGTGSTTGSLTTTAAIVNNGNFALNRSDTLTVANNISGTGSVTQMGGGEVILNGTNTYSGGTFINAGSLLLKASNIGSGAVSFGGGTLRYDTGITTDLSTRTITVGAGGGTLNTNGNNVTFANSIGNSGTGGLTKSGAGTLSLNGATYTGNTTVSTGTLLASGNFAGGAAVSSGATLVGAATFSGPITVASTGVLAPGNGVGTLTTSALSLASGSILNYEFNTTPANDYISVTTPGGLTLNGGGFNLYNVGTTSAFSTIGSYNLIGYSGSLGGTGVGSLSVLNPQAGKSYGFGASGSNISLSITAAGVISDWNVDAAGSWASAGNWSGSVPNGAEETANFTKTLTASRTVTLDGSKTVGGLSFASGAAPLGYTIAQGSSGSLLLNNGANQVSITVGSGDNVISSDVSLDSSVTVAAIDAGASLAFTGAIGGSGSLVKSGNGLLNLTNPTNSFAGNITVAGGNLGFDSGTLSTGNIAFDGGTLRYNAGNTEDVSSRVVTLSTGGGTINTNGNNVTFANAIGNGGAGSLTKSGAGTLTLGGNNTYTGTTSVTGGTLAVSNNQNLGAPASGSGVTLNGGTLASTATFTLDNSGANARPVTIGSSGGGIEVASATTLTIPGAVSGSAGTFTKSGNGTLVLSANNVGSFSAPINVTGGTLRAGGPQANGTQGFGTGAITLGNGATLASNGVGASDGGTSFGNLVNALSVATGNTATLSLAKRITVSSTLTGAGTLNIGMDGIRQEFQGNWGAFTGNINLTGAGEFRIANFQTSVFNNSSLNIGAGVLVQQVFNPTAGVDTIQNIGALSGAAGSILGGNPVGGRFVNWTVGSLNTSTVFAGVIQNDTDAANGFGEPKLTKVGTGTLTLSGNNTYTGSTTVSNGTLRVDGTLASGSAVTVSSGAILSGNGTIGGATTLNSATIGSSGDTLTLGSNLTTNGASSLASGATVNVNGTTTVASGNFTVNGTLGGSGIIGGAGSILVSGTGTLAGNVTASSATTINGGTLGSSGNTLTLGDTLTANGGNIASGSTVNVAGATTFASGTFTVNGTLGGAGTKTVSAGATLNGSGTIIGNTTINGNLAPGNSPGVLTFDGDLTFTNTTVTTMELAGTGGVAGTDFDQSVVTGTLTFDGALNIISYLSFNIDQPGNYDLFAATTAGNFDNVSVGSTALVYSALNNNWTASNVAGTYLYTFDMTSGDLAVSAIPEPSSFAVLAGLAGLSLATLRRRSASALRNRSAA